jgi:hypothetical protein
VVTAVAGVALGAVDLLCQRWLPYPWANLANSSAIWAVAAIGLGMWAVGPWWRAGLSGVVLLVLAVPAYYATATLVLNDAFSNVWSPTSQIWMLFGVLAGVVFGAGGSFARASGWQQILGVALPGAVLFAEAVVLLRRPGDGADHREDVWTAVIEATLGLVLILVVGRSARQRLWGLAASLPLAAIGTLAFLAAGFSGGF